LESREVVHGSAEEEIEHTEGGCNRVIQTEEGVSRGESAIGWCREREEVGVERSVLQSSAEEGMEHAEGGWTGVIQRGV
jgi:hypothetical protein